MLRAVIYLIVVGIFMLRLFFLKESKKNEKSILEAGGMEYGKENSKRLTILHILFYVGCLTEAIIRKTEFDMMSAVGTALLFFSICMLYTVIRLLSGIWTVKLMVAKNHKFNDHWLFRVVKHPNYFLNIVPELVGLALLCHAKYVSLIIGPLYAVVLYIRIREENRVLKEIIIPNGIGR